MRSVFHLSYVICYHIKNTCVSFERNHLRSFHKILCHNSLWQTDRRPPQQTSPNIMRQSFESLKRNITESDKRQTFVLCHYWTHISTTISLAFTKNRKCSVQKVVLCALYVGERRSQQIEIIVMMMMMTRTRDDGHDIFLQPLRFYCLPPKDIEYYLLRLCSLSSR